MSFSYFYQFSLMSTCMVCDAYTTRKTPYQDKNEKMEIKSCKGPKYDEKKAPKTALFTYLYFMLWLWC